MKKLYAIVASFGLILGANAQTKNGGVISQKLVPNGKLKTETSKFRALQTSSRAYSGWLNYALQLDDPNGYSPGAAFFDFQTIFPDSSIIIGTFTDGSTAYNQFMKSATMLDPKNMPVEGLVNTDAFTLDSVAIGYAYLRNLADNIVDTLVIDIIKHNNALLYDMPGSAPTHTYQDIEYDQPSNKVKASNIIATYTYLLTAQDSTSTSKEILIATAGLPQQAAGNRIGVCVSFKPGYSYSITDSLFDMNAFLVFSAEQNGENTDPTFYGTLSDGTSDMNCSYALPTSVRYDINANGWNGYLIPTWAWTPGYSAEHNIISFHVTSVVGIDETKANGLAIGQNFPNPASGITTINYSLETASSQVSLVVTDVTGKTIQVINQGTKAPGLYNVSLDASNFAAGVYNYTLQTDLGSVTKKFFVVK
jgi:hypothetical protein